MEKINTIVDVFLLIDFIICAVSGFMMRNPVLNFRQIHFISGIVLIVLVVLHLILHYNWIKNLFRCK